MALKMGMKPEIVSGNIKEMVKAGHPQKKAIAAALSMKRKSMKKMAEGGMVSEDYDDGADSEMDQDAVRGLGEMNELGKFQEASIENPEHMDAEKMFAKRLYEDSEAGEGYATGGLVIGENQLPMGSKPELDWVNDGTAEPMSDELKAASLDHAVEESVPMGPGLSKEAMEAIEMKRKKRRFSV